MNPAQFTAIETVFAKYQPEMLGALHHWSGDRQAAEDAVQQAFLQAVQSRQTLDGMEEKSIRAWLYTTARRALIDQKRRQAKVRTQLEGDYESPDPDPADAIAVRALVQALEPEQRRLVEMRYFAGLTSAQIGVALGIPAATVRTRLRAALKEMRLSLPDGP